MSYNARIRDVVKQASSTAMDSFSIGFARLIVHFRWPLFLCATALSILSGWVSREVSYNRSFEQMFAKNSELLEPYRRAKKIFGGSEVVLLVYEDENLLAADGNGLRKLSKVSEEVRTVNDRLGKKTIRDVVSLADVETGLAKATNWLPIALVRSPEKSVVLDPDRPLGRGLLELFEGFTHGPDRKTVAVICILEPRRTLAPGEPRETVDPRRLAIEELRRIAKDLPQGSVVGEPVMVVDGFRLIEDDGARLGWWSIVLVGLTFFFCFRSLRWLLVPIGVVLSTQFCTNALLAALGLKLTMVSSMLSAMVTVIGCATVVHLVAKTRAFQSEGMATGEAYAQALAATLVPILGACGTDAIGFSSLWCSSVGPVRDFGTMMAIGSLVVIPSILFVPAAIAIGDPQGKVLGRSHTERWLVWLLGSLLTLVTKRPRLVIAASICATLIAIVSSFWIEVETDFTKNFRSDSEIVRSYEFIEDRLGGAGVWDVMIPTKELNSETLERVAQLETELRAIRVTDQETGQSEPALTKVMGLPDFLELLNEVPGASFIPANLRTNALLVAMPEFAKTLYAAPHEGEPYGHLRLMLRSRERQSATQKKWIIDQTQKAVLAAFPGEGKANGAEALPAAQATGVFVLLTYLVDGLVRDQWIMFVVASIGIAVMVWLCVGDLKLTWMGLVPNLLPVIFVMGSMGWLGLRLNMGAAMIAAVSTGLSVDSSIHFLVAFQALRKKGLPFRKALSSVHEETGAAMCLSTLALTVGFGVLCTSEFIPTVYFGGLVCLAMLGGLAGNLVVLPLLLLLFEDSISKTLVGTAAPQPTVLDSNPSVPSGET